MYLRGLESYAVGFARGLLVGCVDGKVYTSDGMAANRRSFIHPRHHLTLMRMPGVAMIRWDSKVVRCLPKVWSRSWTMVSERHDGGEGPRLGMGIPHGVRGRAMGFDGDGWGLRGQNEGQSYEGLPPEVGAFKFKKRVHAPWPVHNFDVFCHFYGILGI